MNFPENSRTKPQVVMPGWPSAEWRFSNEVAAMSPSPDGYSVILAGRDILQMARLEAGRFVPKRDVRGSRKRQIYSSTDVSWHPLEIFRARVATSSFNGSVLLWDIHKAIGSKESAMVVHKGKRTVNRVCWNKEHPNQLLAGCQDGTATVIDVSMDPESTANICDCKSSVRDVQFSPFYPNYFAAALDSGGLMIWDLRKTKEAIRTFYPAHQGLALCVDWHPKNKDRLASGGRDRTIKVWDLTQTNKPIFKVNTMATVHKVQWRSGNPDHEFQIASAASHFDVRVHIWDLRRPCIPLASCLGRNSVVTGIQWLRTIDSVPGLFSASKDGLLTYHELAHDKAYRPVEHTPSMALSWSPNGDLACVTDVVDRNWGKEEVRDPSGLISLARWRGSQGHEKHTSDFSFFDGGVVRIRKTKIPQRSFDTMIGIDPSLDPQAFKYAAREYSLCPDPSQSLADVCEGNSRVASTLNRDDLSKIWLMMRDICLVVDKDKKPTKESESRKTESQDMNRSFAGVDSSIAHANEDKQGETSSVDELRHFSSTFKGTASALPGNLVFPFAEAPGHQRGEIEIILEEDVPAPMNVSADQPKESDDYGHGPKPDSKFAGIAPKRTVIGPHDFEYGHSYQDIELASRFPRIGDGSMVYPLCGCGCGCPCAMVTDEGIEPCSCGCGCGTSAWAVKSLPTDQAIANEEPKIIPASSRILGRVPDAIPLTKPTFIQPPETAQVKQKVEPVSIEPVIPVDASWILNEENKRNLPYSDAITSFLQECLNSADVQTYVTVLVTLSPILQVNEASLQERLSCTLAYIDILRRMSLHDCAAEIVKRSPDEQIRTISHKSTLFRASCGSCQKPINDSKCGVCKKTNNDCAICRMRVIGAWVFCEGCGHGGHPDHLREWFKYHGECPTGCGHQCDYNRVPK